MPRDSRLFPALLKHWRGRRGHSQLDLALSSEVSARHLSFLETGRAQPSREMVLRLGAALDLPLREQNALLSAAGFSEGYAEPPLEAVPPAVAQAITRMMQQQEPYPLVVMNRAYDVLRVNDAGARLLARFVADPSALGAPPNAMMLLFDRRLARDFVVEWERVAHSLLARLHREALAHPEDSSLSDLVTRVCAMPGVPAAWRQPDFEAPSDPVLTIRLRRDDLELAFLTTVTSFNAPQDVTLDELRIEAYFPLDDATTQACEAARG